MASLGLHAVLLWISSVAAELHAGGPATGNAANAPPARPVRVRQLGAADLPRQLVPTEDIAPLLHQPVLEPLPVNLPTEPLETLPSRSLAESHGGFDDVYLPRRQLDEPPRPLAPIDLLWPANGPPAGHFNEVVSLFIDEGGVVQRVRIDGPGLPDSLQAVTEEVFLSARFSPGLLGGRPVRSWIRLEVEFDAAPTSAPRGARQ